MGPRGSGRLFVATPPSPSRLILEPWMPQTGRHLSKASRKEGTVLHSAAQTPGGVGFGPPRVVAGTCFGHLPLSLTALLGRLPFAF